MTSVGELLKKERESKKITLRQVEKEIKVREKFLNALENNNWQTFPSKIYIIGIIKNYSRFLGLDPQRLTAFFRRDYEKKDDVQFKKRVASNYLTPQTKKIMSAGLVVAFVLFFGYFMFQLSQFLSPPRVSIVSPIASKFRALDNIKITGKTEKEATITIYGEKVYPNKEGIFEYNFPLKEGKNELIIEVIGANGKKSILKKEYFRE